jgi:plasmid stability protein
MAQLTIRTTDELVEQIKRVAAGEGRSMNEWVVFVLRAAVDPEFAGSEAERVRERLRRAGLLEEWDGPSPTRPDPALVAAARVRAGKGKPLSDFVIEGRR